MLDQETAATLLGKMQKECDELRNRLSALIQAATRAGELNQEWKAVADRQRGEIVRLTSERDELRARVSELEARARRREEMRQELRQAYQQEGAAPMEQFFGWAEEHDPSLPSPALEAPGGEDANT